MNLKPQIITKDSPKDIVIKQGDLIENHRYPSCFHRIEGFGNPYSETILNEPPNTYPYAIFMEKGKYGDETIIGGIYEIRNNTEHLTDIYK